MAESSGTGARAFPGARRFGTEPCFGVVLTRGRFLRCELGPATAGAATAAMVSSSSSSSGIQSKTIAVRHPAPD
jgi:hypothetical protein